MRDTTKSMIWTIVATTMVATIFVMGLLSIPDRSNPHDVSGVLQDVSYIHEGWWTDNWYATINGTAYKVPKTTVALDLKVLIGSNVTVFVRWGEIQEMRK